jgi:DNA-binding NarL/FixJ family response regulator
VIRDQDDLRRRGLAGVGSTDARDRRLRVLVADHDGLARSMMRAALNDADRVAIVLSASDGNEALELARHYRPTVVVIDLDIPPAGAAQTVTQILAVSPESRVLTISANDPRGALPALRAGAAGHVAKDVDPGRLAGIVERVASGESIIPQSLIGPLLELLRDTPDGGWRPLHSRLTTREWEIIELLDDGAGTQRIADLLVLSPTTVYSHIKSVLRKLGVHNRPDAIAAAKQLRKHESGSPIRQPSASPSAARPERFTTDSGEYRVKRIRRQQNGGAR